MTSPAPLPPPFAATHATTAAKRGGGVPDHVRIDPIGAAVNTNHRDPAQPGDGTATDDLHGLLVALVDALDALKSAQAGGPTAGLRELVHPLDARPKRARRGGANLTLGEVCEELGIARSTFYDWRAKGKAPRCIKLPNGDLRIRRSEFDRWLSAREDDAA